MGYTRSVPGLAACFCCFLYMACVMKRAEVASGKSMRLLGKHVFPRQIVLFAAGFVPLPLDFFPQFQPSMWYLIDLNRRLVFFGATTYDVHRSIKNNEKPPTREQMEALQDYINSKKN
jgi:hypothetical protein